MKRLSSRLLLALAAACAPASPPVPAGPFECPTGDQAMVRDVIYFGRNKPAGGEVSDGEWREFLVQFVTPRFPDGLTVIHATGQWRGASGEVESEPAEVVTLVHRGNDGQLRSVGEITGEYKQRFVQEAVLRERTPVCVSL